MTSARRDDGLTTLYPFLDAPTSDVDALMDEVARSSEAKAREIVALRERIGRDHGERLLRCARAMARAFARGATLLAFGNGGSATDAQALAALFCAPPTGRPLPALALPNAAATVIALANNVDVEVAFAREMAALARAGDVAVGLSTSGSSADVVVGLAEAHRRGLTTVGFAGYTGGAMVESGAVGHLFVVRSSSIHRIQETQTTLYHVLWELVQAVLDARSDP